MKSAITLLTILFCLPLTAQDETVQTTLKNKKGIEILSREGDWALGISAAPFFSFAGNLFSSDYSPSPYFSSPNPGSIFFKKMNSPNSAIRVSLSLGISGQTDQNGNARVEDEYDKLTNSALSLGVMIGLEKYKDLHGRLRGYYGFDFGVNKSAFSGNRYQSFEPVNGKFKFEDAIVEGNDFVEIGGNTYSVSGQGILGFEFFFLPRVSLSGEFGLGTRASLTTDRKYVPQEEEEVIFNPGSKSFDFYTNTSSIISIMAYF